MINFATRLHYSSRPLTFYEDIKKLCLLHRLYKNVCIHVIVTSPIDAKDLLAWKLLLHFFRDIRQLTIVIIRPKIWIVISDTHVCDFVGLFVGFVIFAGKVINMNSMLYQNYVVSEHYKPPKAIIGLEIKFNQDDIEILNIIGNN